MEDFKICPICNIPYLIKYGKIHYDSHSHLLNSQNDIIDAGYDIISKSLNQIDKRSKLYKYNMSQMKYEELMHSHMKTMYEEEKRENSYLLVQKATLLYNIEICMRQIDYWDTIITKNNLYRVW
jgi:hypothetical protein